MDNFQKHLLKTTILLYNYSPIIPYGLIGTARLKGHLPLLSLCLGGCFLSLFNPYF